MTTGHTLILNSDAQPISFQPLSSIGWKDAVTVVFLGNVSVVHEYENWLVNSPSVHMRVPSVVMSKRYIRFRKLVSFSAENIFLRDEYTCQYCNERFASRDLTLDHVKPRSKGGKLTLTNAVAACAPCNRKRGNDERIKPRREPYHPTYYDLLAKRKKFGIVIPHESWVPYLAWDDNKITVSPPVGMPGYDPPREIEKIRAALLAEEDDEVTLEEKKQVKAA